MPAPGDSPAVHGELLLPGGHERGASPRGCGRRDRAVGVRSAPRAGPRRRHDCVEVQLSRRVQQHEQRAGGHVVRHSDQRHARAQLRAVVRWAEGREESRAERREPGGGGAEGAKREQLARGARERAGGVHFVRAELPEGVSVPDRHVRCAEERTAELHLHRRGAVQSGVQGAGHSDRQRRSGVSVAPDPQGVRGDGEEVRRASGIDGRGGEQRHQRGRALLAEQAEPSDQQLRHRNSSGDVPGPARAGHGVQAGRRERRAAHEAVGGPCEDDDAGTEERVPSVRTGGLSAAGFGAAVRRGGAEGGGACAVHAHPQPEEAILLHALEGGVLAALHLGQGEGTGVRSDPAEGESRVCSEAAA